MEAASQRHKAAVYRYLTNSCQILIYKTVGQPFSPYSNVSSRTRYRPRVWLEELGPLSTESTTNNMPFLRARTTSINLYPRAFTNERRLSGRDPQILPTRIKFLKSALLNLIILQVLFLLLFAYLFGSLYLLNERVHHLNIVLVDYDGGLIGNAVRGSYQSLQGPGFPTLMEKTPHEYPDEAALEQAVCQSHYWAAIYISPDSSSNIDKVLTGSASASYNASNSVSFIWNQARNPTTADGALAANIIKLSDESKASFLNLYLSSKATSNETNSINLSPDTISVISNPWDLQDINIKPTRQGSRVIYNTLLIVLVLIQDFFFLGTLNGLYAQFNM